MKIQRQFVYLADLNPRTGTEPGKVRPVIVLQTNLLNNQHPSTIICPLTTNVAEDTRILRTHFRKGQAGLEQPSDVLIDQIRAIDNKRFVKQLGKAPDLSFQKIVENLATVLDML